MRSAWILAGLLAAATLLGGCRSEAPTPPVPPSMAAAPTQAPVTLKPAPAAASIWTPPDVPLTADLPTYPAEPLVPLSEAPVPQGGPASLRRIAGALAATGDPAAAAGNLATYIGSMTGGRHVYLPSVEPGPRAPTAYIMKHEDGGWTATPICPAPQTVWFAPVQNSQVVAGSTLSTRGYANYLTRGVEGPGPWFHFAFDRDGRVAAVEEVPPPK